MRMLVIALGLGIYVLAAVNGYALEMLWLPAVTVGAAWPYEPKSKQCLRRLLGRR